MMNIFERTLYLHFQDQITELVLLNGKKVKGFFSQDYNSEFLGTTGISDGSSSFTTYSLNIEKSSVVGSILEYKKQSYKVVEVQEQDAGLAILILCKI